MTWHLVLASLTAGFAVANGIDMAFVHRDPPAGARVATRRSRRIMGIVVIIVAVASVLSIFIPFSPE